MPSRRDTVDTEDFIREIEARPSIWNTQCPEYSDRKMRRATWEELVNKYRGDDVKTDEEKREIGQQLQKKWKNIRDCYFRELRRQKTPSGSGASAKGPYVYFNQLLFLDNVASTNITQSNISRTDLPHEGQIEGPYSDDSYRQVMKLKEMSLKPKELILREPSDGACVFCGSSGRLSHLHTRGNHARDSTHQDYSLMLLSCFHIKLIDPSGTGGLCEICVSRLRDAASFRAQVEGAPALQQVKEEPTNPKTQDTLSLENPKPGREKINMKLADYDNFDTFLNHDLMNSDEENQKLTSQELKDHKRLEWTDKELSENDLQIKEETKEDSKRIEWIDQRQYPISNTFKLPALKPNSNECTVCGEVFPNRGKLQHHFEYHFPRYLCELCGKICAKRITYRVHLETHRSERFPCLQCKKSYANRTSLVQHVKTRHNNKKLYSCPKCHVRLRNSYNRKEHLLKEHGVWYNQFLCPECSQRCHTAGRLDAHVRKVHLKEKNVSCPECGGLFFSKTELLLHSRTHSDLRNFICDICSKEFKNRKTLVVHLKIHYNIRNHKCSICGQAFVQGTSLSVHIKSHHKNALPVKAADTANSL